MAKFYSYSESIRKCPYCNRIEYFHSSKSAGRHFKFTGHINKHYNKLLESKWNRLKMAFGKFEFEVWKTL